MKNIIFVIAFVLNYCYIYIVNAVPLEKPREISNINRGLSRVPLNYENQDIYSQNNIFRPNPRPVDNIFKLPAAFNANTNLKNHRLANENNIASPSSTSTPPSQNLQNPDGNTLENNKLQGDQEITPSKIIATLSQLSRSTVVKVPPKRKLPVSYAKVNKYSAKRKQDEAGKTQTESTLEITSVSPIESSFGGLTGLQGLPALSVVQAIKLLVAVFPFIIPIVFVPLLLFTIGMFMIPIVRVNHFVDVQDGELDGLIGLKARALHMADNVSDFLKNNVTRFARNLVECEECIEKISCQLKNKIFKINKQSEDFQKTFNTLIRYVNAGDHTTLTGRIARSLSLENTCSSYKCTTTKILSNFSIPS